MVLSGTHMHVCVCMSKRQGRHAMGACDGWGMGVCGGCVCACSRADVCVEVSGCMEGVGM